MSVQDAAPTVVIAPAAPLVHLLDFSERLSPMLVKELRQGMRSPMFVWGLIVMNLFLAFTVWLTVLEPEEKAYHLGFFGAYCILVCGLLPLRAAGALHDELKENTIDTLVMTELTGWRITLGKWLAVVAQQCLAAITVLPYLIVRYFAGGIDVPMELAWLGIFLLAGMGSAAVLTGLSWIKYFLFRAAIMMGVTFAVGGFCVALLEDIFRNSNRYLLDEMYDRYGWRYFLLFLVPAIHFAFFSLDLGASKVGSSVENRSTRRRLVGVGAIAFYAWIGLPELASSSSSSIFFYSHRVIFIFSMMFGSGTLFLISLQALLEKPVHLVSMVIPWVKRGWWGRLAGRFFYPGWPSGVFFSGALLLLGSGLAMFGLWQTQDEFGFDWFERMSLEGWAYLVIGYSSVVGMLIAPLVIWQIILRRRFSWHFGTWLLLVIALGVLHLGVAATAAGMDTPKVLKWGAPLPTMGMSWLYESIDRYHGSSYQYRPRYSFVDPGQMLNWDDLDILKVSGIVYLSWWVLAMLVAMRAFRRTTALENEAIAALKQPSSE